MTDIPLHLSSSNESQYECNLVVYSGKHSLYRIMGLCQCCNKQQGWTSRHDVLLEFMRGEGFPRTVWSEFKVNNTDCMDYDEFRALLFIALEIFEKIEKGCSRQISSSLGTVDLSDADISKFRVKTQSIRTGTMDSINLMTKKELNQRGNIEGLCETLDDIAPKLAAQFDQDGDEMFCFTEFKLAAIHLQNEYKQLTTGYKAPALQAMSTTAGLLAKSDGS